MWYIFPQIAGLGRSSTSKHYAIQSITEARQYLDHPVLGGRLRECAQALLSLEGRSAREILGHTDTLKLKSSMALFECVDRDPDSVFGQVLEKYYRGERDHRTLDILGRMEQR
ncbi:MAG: DUF1810 domain-containing protein [Chloroflexia bacterium]|nr:DUF1810 domain-containing protein [Chloroflexia bacterium]